MVYIGWYSNRGNERLPKCYKFAIKKEKKYIFSFLFPLSTSFVNQKRVNLGSECVEEEKQKKNNSISISSCSMIKVLSWFFFMDTFIHTHMQTHTHIRTSEICISKFPFDDDKEWERIHKQNAKKYYDFIFIPLFSLEIERIAFWKQKRNNAKYFLFFFRQRHSALIYVCGCYHM